MFTGTDFTYDGVTASSFGLVVVSVGATNISKQFGLQREIRETERNNGKNSFHGLKYKPLEFEITLGREEEWDYATRQAVTEWLFKDNYKELIDTDYPNVIYNAIFYGESQINMVGNIPRYITLNVRTDAPWGWSQEYTYNYNVDTSTAIQITSLSNLNAPVYAEVEFTLESGSSFEIQFDTDKVFKFVNANYSGDSYTLVIGETIYVDNDKKIILSDETGQEDKRFKNFIKSDATKEMSDWFYLLKGINDITLIGDVAVTIRVKYPIII